MLMATFKYLPLVTRESRFLESLYVNRLTVQQTQDFIIKGGGGGGGGGGGWEFPSSRPPLSKNFEIVIFYFPTPTGNSV